MAIFFLLLMNVPVTGVLLHEWIGAGLVAAIFIHLALNRRWIAGVARRFKSAGTKAKGRFVLDTAIAVAAGACVVTGLLISRFLFPWTVSAGSGTLYAAHVGSACLLFVLLIVHVALHRRFVLGILKKGRTGARLKSFAVRAAAGVSHPLRSTRSSARVPFSGHSRRPRTARRR